MVYSNQFWVGSQWYDHFGDDGDRIRALVDARGYKARTRRWTKATLPVKYVIGTLNRTIGSGQAGSVSKGPPVEAMEVRSSLSAATRELVHVGGVHENPHRHHPSGVMAHAGFPAAAG
jgi:hypothetical protein